MTGKAAIRHFALLHIKQLPSGTKIVLRVQARRTRFPRAMFVAWRSSQRAQIRERHPLCDPRRQG
jgi:hypothetical protein